MIDEIDVVGFALVATLVTITPGLDTALVLRAALVRGRVDAAVTAAGVCTGVLVWAVAAATGVSALLTASEAAYDVLRFVGAAYMVVLGVRLLVSGIGGDADDDPAPPPSLGTTRWAAFRTGFLTNLLNPKVGAFYVALLPQFIGDGGSALLGGIVLGLVHVAQGALWFALVIGGAAVARRHLARRRTERWIEAITGTALVGFGIKLARSHTP